MPIPKTRGSIEAGRVPPTATAFEFLESTGNADARGPVSHADLLGAVQRLDPRTERRACPELAVSPRLSSTYNSTLATVGWLEYGFTVLTLEDDAVGVDHLLENDRSLACRSSSSRRGARSVAAR